MSRLAFGLLCHLALVACGTSPKVIPPDLKPQIDQSVSFPELMQDPDRVHGHLVALSGEVLSARMLKDATELEVLELPHDRKYRPTEDRTASQGRFLVLDRQKRDPAAFPPGVPVTIIGEVTGVSSRRQDDTEQRYPVLEMKHVHLWLDAPPRGAGGSSVGVGVGFGTGFGIGRGGFGGIGFGTGF
jgi:outer membrane lipoprotein